MNRDELVAAAASAIGLHIPTVRPVVLNAMGATVLDAILPQVTTVEELEALPAGSIVIDNEDEPQTKLSDGWWRAPLGGDLDADQLSNYGPLTVVWTP